ncbi:CTP:2,3-di-O-geranylgeranyl-sn-glycero-1-phosphate cytidyltransferase [Methanosarcina thermophila]|jgi:phytol kinase|uniref:CTP:2, 3-di-O-geranylgeranyl-sn-glycero-1-phosphate cytidyltransferase n=3 Tax=Methanosarcina thermophila TaxID=2210 RepID=A0A1I7A296_METTE|nr:diacylglycerol/polyprenol kinase family protein [Methanosarcina thermophila]ALK05452.1 MAG: phosphatidate cytidylyltransferase [Methanosarcina sp. 795]AKB14268.1 phytol kinase [Methanosarcina thermophila TM-1]AKB15093.1 phytol kinase [Methanosarcina thermophila CHTI-55]NLU56186.1 CTP--2,3-di-O-geranylgeranyl-sn-glycero-1-phosphate cytidyltransferase [Methanosarcina thermophila]SFT69056.1 CTP:2,3-di-O-geranylgeranyl-sn-glycero-1-phosphate cytidyltransferase [Methanosarcina thermophila]
MPSREFILELLRKSVHLVSILIVLIYEFFGKEAVLWVLMLFLVTVLALDYLRIEHNIRIPLFYIMYRKTEADRFGGHIFFALGAISVISLFSREIAYAAILMTTFGDLSAALIGKFYGKRRVFQKIFKNDKSIEGSASEFIIDFLIGMLIVGNLIVSLVMAFFATLMETAVNKIDDNLIVPVFSGFFGQVTLALLACL